MSFVQNVPPNVIFPKLLSDEPEWESYLHLQQMILLLKCLEWWWRDRNDFFKSLEFKGFQLITGKYEELQPDERGWLWSQQLKFYLGIFNDQLRFFTPEGDLVLTPEETGIQTQFQLEQECKKTLELEQRLRKMGIDK